MKKEIEQSVERIETTIGELISVITEIALEDGKSEEESYELTSKTLEKILSYSTEEVKIPEQLM